MNTIRKWAALLLALCLMLGLAACAADAEDIAAAGEIVSAVLDAAQTDASDKGVPDEELALIPAEEETAEEVPETDEEPEEAPEETPIPPDLSLPEDPNGIGAEPALDPDGSYTTKEDVALYLYTYGELPKNFITKNEARDLGWSGGGLDDYADGMCIGGDRFGNYEGVLPEGNYHECDIDTLHASSRGAKRIVYSDDGYIYYTEDHYESFELLYPEEG